MRVNELLLTDVKINYRLGNFVELLLELQKELEDERRSIRCCSDVEEKSVMHL